MSEANFLQTVEAFMAKHGLSATRFGVLVVGDTKFVKTLRGGRKVRQTTEAAVRQWMLDHGEQA